MSDNYYTDAHYLLEEQYSTAKNLSARIRLHAEFSRAEADLHEWIFDALLERLPENANILEVGTGRGDLWKKNAKRIPPTWNMTLTDFSAGMLEDNRTYLSKPLVNRFNYREADVQDLPFADQIFDVVIANMMLYHVPNLPLALSELSRVLKTDGLLFAGTNGDNHMLEVFELAHQVDENVSRDLFGFSTQSGANDLAPHFSQVEFYPYESDLWVTDAQAILDYVGSMSRIAGAALLAEHGTVLKANLEAQIAADGGILIHKDTGLFIASGRR